MCLLFETIKVKGNRLQHVDYHNLRLNKSRRELFDASDSWDLHSLFDLPILNPAIIYRCKLIYGANFHSVEFFPYTIKPLQTLKLVRVDSISYQYKYLDRKVLDYHKLLYPEADDIIFVVGTQITDCTYANLVFSDGQNWITPSSPLLRGTKRQQYIDEQIISEAVIDVDGLKRFKKLKIINAMIDLADSPEIDMVNIF